MLRAAGSGAGHGLLMTQKQAVVSIASSRDEAMGAAACALDAPCTTAQVQAVVWRALDQDRSERSLRQRVGCDDWVVLKPNIVTSPTHRCSYWHNGQAHPGQVTDVRVIQALIAYLLARCRPRRVTIAEGGAEWQRGTGEDGADGWTVAWPEFGGLSYAGLVEQFGRSHPGVVDIVDLNEDEIRFLPVPDPGGSGLGALQRVGQELRPPERYGRWAYVPGTGTPRTGYHVPATVLDCDRLISVPALKTHTCATTLALKNYVGILPTHPSGVVRKGDVHQGDVQKGFIDLVCYHPPDYSVLEGFWSTEGDGPQWGENLRHNVVVASADPVAADAIASELMGFNPEDIDYLHYAAAKRLGTFARERIELVGTPLPVVRRKFATAAGRKGIRFTARGNRSWLVATAARGPWQRLDSEERYIDLARFFAPASPAMAWAAVEVRAAQDVAAILWASADGAFQVALDGQVVAARAEAGEHVLGETKVPVRLAAGRHRLEVRVRRGPAGMGFTAILCDEDGYGHPGVGYEAEAGGAAPA